MADLNALVDQRVATRSIAADHLTKLALIEDTTSQLSI